MHWIALIGGLLVPLWGPVSAAECVDTALVLAIDGSGSITDQEYDMQRQAFAAAFESPEVIDAVTSAGDVALSVVIWGDGEFSADRGDWFLIHEGQSLQPFIADMLARPRRTWGNTDIGAGLWQALDMLEQVCAHNSVINVSGDGKATTAPKRRVIPTLPMARKRAAQMQVTINALAMSAEVPDLADYYARNVLSGVRSFVIDARRPEDFGSAIRRKLKRELQRPVVSMLVFP